MKKKSIKINAILNIIKQCCSIIFPLITFPYVSRVLGAANFGKYSFSNSVIAFFMTFAALGVPIYALREGARIREDKKKIQQFSSEVFSINIFTMLISYSILLITIFFVGRLQKDVLLTYILSINIITSILGRDWINSIYEDFLYITMRYIIFQMISVILIFIFVKNSDDCIKYTIIMLFSNSGGYIANFFYTRKYVPIKITFHLNLKQHLKPILYLFGSAIAIMIYVQSDITILGFLRTEDEVGVYTLASKVYVIVKSLLNAVIMVILPRLSYYLGEENREAYDNLLKKLKNTLITLIFPCVVGLFCMAKDVMMLVGGKEYLSGTGALQILCIALIFAVLGCFYAQGILVPNRKEKYFTIVTVISATVNILLNVELIPIFGIKGAALTTVIAEIIIMLMCQYFSKEMIKLSNDKKNMFSVIIGCIGVAGVCYGVHFLSLHYLVELCASILFSIIIYGISLLLTKNDIFMKFIKEFKNKLKK